MRLSRIVKRHLFLMLVVSGILWTIFATRAFSGQRVMPYDDNSWGSVSFLITLLFNLVFWLPSQVAKFISGNRDAAEYQWLAGLVAIAIAIGLDYALRTIQDRRREPEGSDARSR
jgi:hypothetical protein